MIESKQIEAAKNWVFEKYPYNRTHLLKSLEWLDRIAPGSSESVRLATLTHDMERAFPGPDQPVASPGKMNDPQYYAAHSARSARIVGAWLREQGLDEPAVLQVEELIRAHEVGGSPEANLVQAADSLSFLETNIDLFIGMLQKGSRTYNEVAAKFQETYERIQVPLAREIALPMYKDAMARLNSANRQLSSPTVTEKSR
jgi:uncharacterized protein DUF4202